MLNLQILFLQMLGQPRNLRKVCPMNISCYAVVYVRVTVHVCSASQCTHNRLGTYRSRMTDTDVLVTTLEAFGNLCFFKEM